MQFDDSHIDLIDKSLTGSLDSEEQSLFESFMQHASFQSKYDEIKELKNAIRIAELRRVKKILEEEEQSITEEITTNRKRPSTIYLLCIAAIIIGLSVGLWFLIGKFNAANQSYLAEYFAPQKNTFLIINKSEIENRSLADIFSFYDNKDFNTFLVQIEQEIARNPREEFFFYKANALLATGQVGAAIPVLENIERRNKLTDLSDSQWLLALAYLESGNSEGGKRLLSLLSEYEFYSDRANEILANIQ